MKERIKEILDKHLEGNYLCGQTSRRAIVEEILSAIEGDETIISKGYDLPMIMEDIKQSTPTQVAELVKFMWETGMNPNNQPQEQEKKCPVCWKPLENGIVKNMCVNDDCPTNGGNPKEQEKETWWNPDTWRIEEKPTQEAGELNPYKGEFLRTAWDMGYETGKNQPTITDGEARAEALKRYAQKHPSFRGRYISGFMDCIEWLTTQNK